MHAVPELQPTLLGIHSMLASKAIRHEAAWQQYVASKELARQQHHQVSAAAAAALAARIKSIAADVEHAMSVLAEDQVMVLDKQQVLQVSLGGNLSTDGTRLCPKYFDEVVLVAHSMQ